jgi:hypothetical protein
VKRSTPPDHPSLVPEVHPAEASRHWTTPRCPVPVSQGYAPHLAELQRLQAFRREWPTVPASTSSPTTRRAWRAPATSATGRGRRWSIPARRRGGQRHLRRTRVAGEQKTTEAQRPTDIGGNHQCPRPLSVVRIPNHLYPDGSMAQLRSSGQVPSPRRSGDPREQGKESISGRGKQHQRHLPPDALRHGVALKELHESDTPFFGIVPTEGECPLRNIYMPVTFGTPKNYRTEFLRFEVASFDCGYNAIIGRPGLAKFMAFRPFRTIRT